MMDHVHIHLNLYLNLILHQFQFLYQSLLGQGLVYLIMKVVKVVQTL